MINKATVVGRLGGNPEIKEGKAGPLATFSVATEEKWREKNSGEMQSKTDWHNIVVYDERLVKIASDFLEKGKMVYLEGKMQTREWEGNDGQKRQRFEVVLPKFGGVLKMLGD